MDFEIDFFVTWITWKGSIFLNTKCEPPTNGTSN